MADRKRDLNETCPKCATYPIKAYEVYVQALGEWVFQGKVCPNPICDYQEMR